MEELKVDKELLGAAMALYCWETGVDKIDMLKFDAWCKINHPEVVEELEKFAANIFNDASYNSEIVER